MRRLFVLAVVTAVVVVACKEKPQTTPPKTSTTTVNPQAVPERSPSMNPITPPSSELPSQQMHAVATKPIEVQLTEYEIRIPETLPAGHQVFHIANAGTMNHNFAVEGNGISKKLASDLARGDTADMDFVLRRGTYKVFCPVDQHRGRGMERTITVK